MFSSLVFRWGVISKLKDKMAPASPFLNNVYRLRSSTKPEGSFSLKPKLFLFLSSFKKTGEYNVDEKFPQVLLLHHPCLFLGDLLKSSWARVTSGSTYWVMPLLGILLMGHCQIPEGIHWCLQGDLNHVGTFPEHDQRDISKEVVLQVFKHLALHFPNFGL